MSAEAGLNYVAIQALVARGVARGLLKYGAVPDEAQRVHLPEEVWASVDWSQSNAEIAAVTGAKYSSVSVRRAKMAPHTVRHRKSRKG